jgi:hypothetical protein
LIRQQDKVARKGFIANWENSVDDFRRILSFKNVPAIGKVVGKLLAGHGLDVSSYQLVTLYSRACLGC